MGAALDLPVVPEPCYRRKARRRIGWPARSHTLISDMPADESYAVEGITSSLACSAGSVSEIPVAMNPVRP
jgi:hypothetical protein